MMLKDRLRELISDVDDLVLLDDIAERDSDDDHFYGAWTKGGGRASASARQGEAFGRDRYGRFVQQVGTFPKDTVDGPRGNNIDVVKALDTFPPDATIRMYHGTTLSRAREILNDKTVHPDDLNSVGLTTSYPDARKYGTYKATAADPAVTLEVAVKRSELGASDPGRAAGWEFQAGDGWTGLQRRWPDTDRWLSEESGGSGTNSVLVYQIGRWPGVALTGAKVIRHHPASGGAAYHEAGDDDHFYGAFTQGGGRAAPGSAAQVAKAPESPEAKLAAHSKVAGDRIRNLPYEHLVVYDALGQKLADHTEKNPQRVAMRLSAAVSSELNPPALVMHNHPNNSGPSPQDPLAGWKWPSVREVRVVTKDWNYSLRRKADSWGDMEAFQELAQARYTEVIAAMKPGDFAGASHELWSTLAPKMGWQYTRTPVGAA